MKYVRWSRLKIQQKIVSLIALISWDAYGYYYFNSL